jgi:hypothetical protein
MLAQILSTLNTFPSSITAFTANTGSPADCACEEASHTYRVLLRIVCDLSTPDLKTYSEAALLSKALALS